MLARLLRPRYAVARRYPGRRGRWWRQSFTHLYDVPAKERHTVETHLDALRRLGLPVGPEHRRLRLVPGPAADDWARQQLAAWGLTDRSFLIVHPTSRWLFKCWPEAHMGALLTRLAARGLTLIVTAGPDAAEQDYVRHTLARAPASVKNLAGRLTLKQLAALVARARLFIGVDSAPMHMAAAVGTPVVAFFGPSGDQEWAPWQVPCRVLTEPVSCRPCGLAGCGEGQVSDCLAAIGVDRAERAVLELMAATEGTRCASS
jgi:heptosyltransferase-3